MLSENNIGIVILAAGSSSRLGRPKQLLELGGTTLLSHTITEAVHSNACSAVIVLGANGDLIANEIDGDIISIVKNKNWEEGMASSIRVGLDTLLNKTPSIEEVIFMVCDQPYISSLVLNDLISKHQQTGKPIVTSNYGEAIGPPALFHKSLFKELMQLKGDVGARKIIERHSNEVATVLFSKGSIDIDTIEDYKSIIES